MPFNFGSVKAGSTCLCRALFGYFLFLLFHVATVCWSFVFFTCAMKFSGVPVVSIDSVDVSVDSTAQTSEFLCETMAMRHRHFYVSASIRDEQSQQYHILWRHTYIAAHTHIELHTPMSDDVNRSEQQAEPNRPNRMRTEGKKNRRCD